MKKEIIRFKERGLPMVLRHLKMREGVKYQGMHSHGVIEIVYVKSGVLSCTVNEKTVRLLPDQVIFINGNVGHRLFSKNAEIVYVQIDAGVLREKADDRFGIYAFIQRVKAKPYMMFSKNEEIVALLHKITVRYDEDLHKNRWYLKAYLYEMVAFMYSQSFIAALTVSEEQIERIAPIVQYIDENFTAPITLDDICLAVGYNKYTVCHTFKAVTGATAFEYINFLRVNVAIERLKEKKHTILEIAVNSGFSSATYFNRVFKNLVGCAPSVYRKLLNDPFPT